MKYHQQLGEILDIILMSLAPIDYDVNSNI